MSHRNTQWEDLHSPGYCTVLLGLLLGGCLMTQQLPLGPAVHVPKSFHLSRLYIYISRSPGPGTQPRLSLVLTISPASAHLAPILTSAQRFLQNTKVHVEKIALPPLLDRTGVSRPMPTQGVQTPPPPRLITEAVFAELRPLT